MANTFNLVNKNFILFFFITLVIIGILIFYNVIKPSNKNNTPTAFNFQPYPNISPKNIPDNNVGSIPNSCYDKLIPCDLSQSKNLQCNSCSGDFICVDVKKNQGLNSNLKINNQDVPDSDVGKGWCIPRLPATQNCNSYTGKWLWSNNENCKNDQASSQCWSCECTYPDLFNGNDCSTQLACKAILDNANVTIDNLVGQDGNILVSTEALSKINPEIPINTIWNPNLDLSKMPDSEKKVLMTYSPYDADENKNPYFRCACGTYPCKTLDDCSNAGMRDGYECRIPQGKLEGNCQPSKPDGPADYSMTYVNLENDPYMCHINPCGKINNFSTSKHIPITGICSQSQKSCKTSSDCTGINEYCTKLTCDCSNADIGNFLSIDERNFNATSENNSLYGTCIEKDEIGCEYDQLNKECICKTGYNRQCKSKYANIGSELPDCSNTDNPIGYECYDPCPLTTCNYRGIPSYKIGKCENTNVECTSNKDCGKGICKYIDNCQCICQNPKDPDNIPMDVCSKINNIYSSDKDSLKDTCKQYNDICKYSDTDNCTAIDLDTIKPYISCINPRYSGESCQDMKCANSSVLNFSVGGGTKCFRCMFGVQYNYIDNDILKFCSDPNKPVNKINSLYTDIEKGSDKKFCKAGDNRDDIKQCDVTCDG